MTHADALAVDGFVSLDDLFSNDETEALLQEAVAQRVSARPWSSDRYALSRRGQVSSPRAHRSASPGPALRALHESSRLRELLAELTGRHFFATRSSYLFYSAGDFIGLHTDIDPCQVTLVTGVLGDPGPLVLHPELVPMAPPRVLQLSRRSGGFPPGGRPVAIPRDGVLVLRGSGVPHHRPPARTECAIATLCYAALG
jgi:alkylated DNA repair dioxygenase AlkB